MKNTLLILFAGLFVLAACTTQPLFPVDNSTNVTNPVFNGTNDSDMGDDTDSSDMTDSEDTDADDTNGEDTDSDSDSEQTDNEEFSQYDAVIEVVEGELVALNTRATDPDGEEVELSFGAPLNNEGQWQTEQGDAGEYEVIVTATDGQDTTEALVLIRVTQANSAPVITGPDVLSFDEGDIVDLGVYTITDPDDDEVVISYSGWMTSSEYRTDFEDAGVHSVTIIAEDSFGNQAVKDVTVEVENENRRPRLVIDEMTVEVVEGDTAVIDAQADDPDGDEVSVSFEAPFDSSGEWQTQDGDAGEYEIDVTASDGTADIIRTVTVVVFQANRPPVIEIDGNVVVDEGETVDLSDFVTVTDPEGEDVTVSYSGWMSQETRATDFDDAGTYTVTVTASDGERQVSEDIAVTVENVNRPPVFIREA